jgi:hypothetical protein
MTISTILPYLECKVGCQRPALIASKQGRALIFSIELTMGKKRGLGNNEL